MADSTSYENAYTSAMEVFEMWSNPPEKLFCYPRDDTGSWLGLAVTWIGEPLSRPRTMRYGARYRDNFGGVRQSVTFQGLSGHWYSGTRYMGNGDYIRAKRIKSSNPRR